MNPMILVYTSFNWEANANTLLDPTVQQHDTVSLSTNRATLKTTTCTIIPFVSSFHLDLGISREYIQLMYVMYYELRCGALPAHATRTLCAVRAHYAPLKELAIQIWPHLHISLGLCLLPPHWRQLSRQRQGEVLRPPWCHPLGGECCISGYGKVKKINRNPSGDTKSH